jgi:hypothetical protein
MRRSLVTTAVVVSLLWAYSLIQPGRVRAQGQDDDSNSKIQKGFASAPLPLNLRGKNPSLVGLGSYLVNAAGDCNGCHTVNFEPYLPGGNPFNGEPERIDPDKYLVGGSEFGPFVSRNLRPDAASGLPAGLTLDQFFEVMRKGTDFKNVPPTPFPSPLLQVMPWPGLSKMTDRDIRAIYEYLSALPAAP